jgi:hypothetical protein
VSWTLPDFFVRDPKLQAPTEFPLPNGDTYHNPRRLPEKWLKAYLDRHPQLLAIDVMRAWDKSVQLERKSAQLERRLQRWILVSNLVSAVLGVLLVLAKFFPKFFR